MATNRTDKELIQTLDKMNRIVKNLDETISDQQAAIRTAQNNINTWQAEIERSLQQKLRTEGQIEIMEQWLAETQAS